MASFTLRTRNTKYYHKCFVCLLFFPPLVSKCSSHHSLFWSLLLISWILTESQYITMLSVRFRVLISRLSIWAKIKYLHILPVSYLGNPLRLQKPYGELVATWMLGQEKTYNFYILLMFYFPFPYFDCVHCNSKSCIVFLIFFFSLFVLLTDKDHSHSSVQFLLTFKYIYILQIEFSARVQKFFICIIFIHRSFWSFLRCVQSAQFLIMKTLTLEKLAAISDFINVNIFCFQWCLTNTCIINYRYFIQEKTEMIPRNGCFELYQERKSGAELWSFQLVLFTLLKSK